jgi:hypothetical protein
VAAIMAIAYEVVDELVDKEMDTRCTNSHTATWTIMPLKHADRESKLKTTHIPAIQTPP